MRFPLLTRVPYIRATSPIYVIDEYWHMDRRRGQPMKNEQMNKREMMCANLGANRKIVRGRTNPEYMKLCGQTIDRFVLVEADSQ